MFRNFGKMGATFTPKTDEITTTNGNNASKDNSDLD